jgi:hypothetical protein
VHLPLWPQEFLSYLSSLAPLWTSRGAFWTSGETLTVVDADGDAHFIISIGNFIASAGNFRI